MIPSKYYYDDDTKTQWNRKKQTKSQAKASKKSKFDPASKSTAAEVSKERAANAKPAKLPPTKESIQKRMKAAAEEEEAEESEEGSEEDSDEEAEETTKNEKDTESSDELDETSDLDDAGTNEVYDDDGNVLEIEVDQSKAQSKSVQKKPDPQRIEALRSQLADKIKELREKRKAPGTTVKGAPLNREAILEARREKQRIAKEKRLLKRKREEEEEGDSDTEGESNDASDEEGSSLVFSQVVFKDGDKATGDLKDIRKKKSNKGPRDILGQLKHIEAKKSKLQSMDAEKRENIETKTKWSRALAQAEGEKIRDDEKMLKKSLKKQTKQKKKSARLWKDRQETVTKSIAEKQKKREDNIALKRERNKLKSKKAKIRAGFEGRRKSSGNKRARRS